MNRTVLDDVSIASPCTADWGQMKGDERRRFCGSCKLHVHNLSGMTADAAMALLRQGTKERVCVRFFRRADGTVLTRDCPAGLRQKMRRAWARAAALWLAVWGAVACGGPAENGDQEPPVQVEQGKPMTGTPVPPPKPEPGEHMGLVGPTKEQPQEQPREQPTTEAARQRVRLSRLQRR
ncbi:MAG TPA: hypothetical protein VF384_19790 [Planctomycetota bacterium]